MTDAYLGFEKPLMLRLGNRLFFWVWLQRNLSYERVGVRWKKGVKVCLALIAWLGGLGFDNK